MSFKFKAIADLSLSNDFVDRHIGPSKTDQVQMLKELGFDSMKDFIHQVIPQSIQSNKLMSLPLADLESSVVKRLKEIAVKNKVFRSYIGMGYLNTHTPAVILRNVLEDPVWYTSYTPYQPEISQGRLEALLNFQTMITELTGMEIANASLLDEGTAAAEAMLMAFGVCKNKDKATFAYSKNCHPQVIDVLRSRSFSLGIKLEEFEHEPKLDSSVFGVLWTNPDTFGTVYDLTESIGKVHQNGSLAIVSSDLLSLALVKCPGEMGADVVVGNSQCFGVPLGFGGPHAGFFSTRDRFKRQMPGRLVGVSKDRYGRKALRLALQTREQHIRREKATSNICTAQSLLAIMSGFYAVYHGPKGIQSIACRVHHLTNLLKSALVKEGLSVSTNQFFNTITFCESSFGFSSNDTEKTITKIKMRSQEKEINLRYFEDGKIGFSFDETVRIEDLVDVFYVFTGKMMSQTYWDQLNSCLEEGFSAELMRTSSFLEQEVFNQFHSETELLRYIQSLQEKDLSLAHAMIPLGSCTMKLNATAELLPISWPEFSQIHPFVPMDQAQGYIELINDLNSWLAEITGLDAVSLQPNAGSQGEFSGLLAIRKYFLEKNETQRTICLIPQSAHGTNPASAVLAGMKVVVVACDKKGNIDISDLKNKANEHKNELAALMVTYPSTHGVFEEGIKEICDIIHHYGGQVYMDGANLNAQLGWCKPGEIGADVCHLNLHKTFAIPHGGGGPGIGPIAVKSHLSPFLPGHFVLKGEQFSKCVPAVASAPWGSAGILPISWAYISLMGAEGLKQATEVAILNANYIAAKLDPYFPVLYKGSEGFVAHECILDTRLFKESADISVDDIAKRLIDYGFHAPTMSFPVPGTLMVEPTESESKFEIDRFCQAMISIRKEIAKIENGQWDKENNPLKRSPHCLFDMVCDEWENAYSREEAAFPMLGLKQRKYWAPVSRIDNAYGDRHLICNCTGFWLNSNFEE